MRLDFLHKLSTELIQRYDTICLEDLDIQGLIDKNMEEHRHDMTRAIQSVSWFEFVAMLKYKADWNGKNIIRIGRFDPSSKTCHCCGYVKSDLDLDDRKWTCPHCGTRHDRDINAAMNIKQFALRNNGPQVSGLLDAEGKVVRLPNRQDSKS